MTASPPLDVSIRTASDLDRSSIRDVHLSAFPDSEGQAVAEVAVRLLDASDDLGIIPLVAEIDHRVVGHIAFSPANSDADNNWTGYILAPLGVRPEHHRQGIGSRLVDAGMQRLQKKRIDTLFVYGDPDYYGKFGFSADRAEQFTPPYQLQYPFGWQAIAFGQYESPQPGSTIACVEALRDPGLW